MGNKIKCPKCGNDNLIFSYEYDTSPTIEMGQVEPKEVIYTVYKIITCPVCFSQCRIVEKELIYVPKEGWDKKYVKPKKETLLSP